MSATTEPMTTGVPPTTRTKTGRKIHKTRQRIQAAEARDTARAQKNSNRPKATAKAKETG